MIIKRKNIFIVLFIMMSLLNTLFFSLLPAEAENIETDNMSIKLLNYQYDNKETAYQYEIDETVFKVLENTEEKSVSFGFITDLHFDDAQELSKTSIKKQLIALVEIANNSSLDFIVLGGDLYSGDVLKENKQGAKHLLIEMLEPLNESKKPVLVLKGNHDDNSYYNIYDPTIPLKDENILSCDEYYSYTNARFQGLIDSTDNYFFYDLDKKNTRIICLNASDYPLTKNEDGTRIYAGSNYYGYSEEQLKWLVDIALGDRNKRYIILSHFGTDMYTVDWRDELNLIMKSLNEKTIYAGVGTSRDFSGYKGLELFCFGHLHADKISNSDKIGGAIAISTGSAVIDNTPVSAEESTNGYDRVLGRTYDNYSECLFDIIMIKSGEVRCLRFGAGEDRSIKKDSPPQTEASALDGWIKENGIWYFYKAGDKQTGWQQDGSSWYYLDANIDNAMRTGWLQQDSNWYYLSDSGAMVTGTYTLDGKVGSFDSSGIWLGYQ